MGQAGRGWWDRHALTSSPLCNHPVSCEALEQAKEKIAQLTEEKGTQEGGQHVITRTQSATSTALTNGLPQPSQFDSERQGYLAQIQTLQEQCRKLEATVAAERQKGRGRGVGGLGRKEGEKGASSPDFNALFGRWVAHLVLGTRALC